MQFSFKRCVFQQSFQKNQSLDSLAKNKNIIIETASAINQINPTLPASGNEPTVIGTAFALNEGETSELIAGEKEFIKLS